MCIRDRRATSASRAGSVPPPFESDYITNAPSDCRRDFGPPCRSLLRQQIGEELGNVEIANQTGQAQRRLPGLVRAQWIGATPRRTTSRPVAVTRPALAS